MVDAIVPGQLRSLENPFDCDQDSQLGDILRDDNEELEIIADAPPLTSTFEPGNTISTPAVDTNQKKSEMSHV